MDGGGSAPKDFKLFRLQLWGLDAFSTVSESHTAFTFSTLMTVAELQQGYCGDYNIIGCKLCTSQFKG